MRTRALTRASKVTVLGLVLIATASVALATSSRGATTLNELALPSLLRTSGDPAGMAIDPATRRAYVADTSENTLFVFDLATGAVLAHIGTGLGPSQVVLAGGRAFVSNFADRTLTVVDTATNRATKTLALGGLGLALDPAGQRLYVAEATRIAVLDLSTDRLVDAIEAPSGARVWGLAVDPASGRLYTTDIASPRMLVFDTTSGRLVREVALSAPARFGIAAGAPGQIVVATHTDKDPELVAVDAQSGAVLARRAVAPFTNAVALQPSSGLVFTTSAHDRSVMSVDLGVRATLSKAKLADGAGAVAIDPHSGEPLVVSGGGSSPPARAFPDVVPLVRP